MRVRVLTIFPELFEPFLSTSLIGRAREKGLLDVRVFDLREFTEDRHRSVDDEPYGGGGGMVMTAPPWIRAVRAVSEGAGVEGDRPWRVLLSPQGARLDEARVRGLAARAAAGGLVLLCGRYEGIDERVRETVVDEEISIGDYVLSGGELPAMVLIEALVAAGAGGGGAGRLGGERQLPGGPARLSALHAAAGGGGARGSGGADLRGPCGDQALAGERGAPGDGRQAAGPAGAGSAGGRREGSSGRSRGRLL